MTEQIVPREYIVGKGISASKQTKLDALAGYDLSRMTSNFIDKGRRFSPEQVWPIKAHFGKADAEIAKTLEWEFKKFVALTLMDDKMTLAPSGPVDMYWHFLILHTQEYRDFCYTMWGYFQHHPRGSSESERSNNDILFSHDPIGHESRNENSFSRLLECYEEVFGKADTMVWCHPDMEIKVVD